MRTCLSCKHYYKMRYVDGCAKLQKIIVKPMAQTCSSYEAAGVEDIFETFRKAGVKL